MEIELKEFMLNPRIELEQWKHMLKTLNKENVKLKNRNQNMERTKEMFYFLFDKQKCK